MYDEHVRVRLKGNQPRQSFITDSRSWVMRGAPRLANRKGK